MPTVKATPEIRFKGFSGDWEQRKVTELGEIYIGLVTTMTKHYVSKGTLLIRNSDIKDGKFEFSNNPIYLDNLFAQTNESRRHKIGDIITVHTGDIGTSAIITSNEVNSLGFATIVTRPNVQRITSNYLCTFLNTDKHKQWARAVSTGDGRTNYNLGDYYELIVPVPSIKEQIKIASVIQNFNNLITFHQYKCDALKEIKKSLLAKMFPANGESVPAIRFKGFTDDWEQRKLCNLISINSGKDYKHLNTGNIPVYGTGGYMLSVDEALSKHEDAIGLGRKGTIDKPYVLEAPFWTVDTLFYCIPLPYVSLNFMNCVFHSIDWKSKDESTGVPSLSKIAIGNTETRIPEINEQIQIGSVFDKIDNLITLHQRKCDMLKEIKQTLLEKMFV